MKGATRTKLDAAIAKLPASKLGAANRLFVWSADLVAETVACPWKEDSATPKSSAIDAVLDCVGRLTGPW